MLLGSVLQIGGAYPIAIDLPLFFIRFFLSSD